jgi:hypothetical protein
MNEPIVLHSEIHIEVHPLNTDYMTWNEAKEWCTTLGKDWRLPTREELHLLWKQRNVIGGFTNDSYWSSSIDVNFAWCQYFLNGNQFDRSKHSVGRVRAVRTFTPQTHMDVLPEEPKPADEPAGDMPAEIWACRNGRCYFTDSAVHDRTCYVRDDVARRREDIARWTGYPDVDEYFGPLGQGKLVATYHITKEPEPARWWCRECQAFVEEGHRCEQWAQVTHIPGKAIAAIKAEGGKQ